MGGRSTAGTVRLGGEAAAAGVLDGAHGSLGGAVEREQRIRTRLAAASGDAAVRGSAGSASTRVAAVDGLRGVAACSVLLFHVWRDSTPTAGAGVGVPVLDAILSHLWIGVTIFFVLSGYLLLQPFVDHALGVRRSFPSLRRYGRSRLLRIVPGYWTALAGCFVLAFDPDLLLALIVLVPLGLAIAAGRLAGRRALVLIAIAAPCAVAALLLIVPPLGATALKSLSFLQIYLPSATIIGPAWTLCVEVTFYLAVPLVGLLLLVCCRHLPQRLRPLLCIAILAGLAAIGPLYRAAMLRNPSLPEALPACADQFAVGGMVAVVMSSRLGLARLGRRAPAFFAVLALLALVVLLLLVHAPRVPVDSTWFDGGVGVVFALFLLALLNGWDRGTGWLASRPLVWLGTISYGIYLWHEPLILFAQRHGLISGESALSFVPTALAALAVSVVVAGLQWRLVEAPSLRLKGTPLVRLPGDEGFLLETRARLGAFRARLRLASRRSRLQLLAGLSAVLIVGGAVIARVPQALRATRVAYRAVPSGNGLARELAPGDALGIDHDYQLQALALIPRGATFAVLRPFNTDVALNFYRLDPAAFEALPAYFQYLLSPAREVSGSVAQYILCYACNTTPWDGRTDWLFTGINGEAIGRVVRR